ncbi:MAG: TniQ family protein [Anaerolineae bacterium]|nr:TniQ family protein [Anaerolineae bacterium]
MKEIRRFLRLSPLLPGESLPSFLVRLAQLNHYPNLTTISQLCRERLSEPDSITCPTRTATYEVLAALVKIKADDLYQASAHRLAATLNPPTQASETMTLPSGQVVSLLTGFSQSQLVWSETRVQFCPLCLAEAAYHRQGWLPKLVTICLPHHCLLVSGCPGCGQKIKLGEIVAGHCFNCGFVLAQAPVVSVAEDEFGLFSQAAIQFWLNLSPEPGEYRQYALPEQPAPVLHYFLYGLSCALMRLVRQSWAYLYASTTVKPPAFPLRNSRPGSQAEAYLLYATALKGIIHWPDGFYELLEALKWRDNRRPNQSIARDFEQLLARWLGRHWQHPAFQFLQEKFDEYMLHDPRVALPCNALIHRIYGPLRAKFPYMTLEEAAAVLHFSPQTMERLVRLDWLVRCEPAHNDLTQAYTFVNCAEVRALEQRWHNGIPLSDAARLLGTSADLLQGLIHTGVILLGPEGSEELIHIKLRPRTIEYLLAEVRSEIITTALIDIDLTRVVQLLTDRGFRVISVYEYALAQFLRHLRPTTSWPFNKSELFDDELVVVSGDIRLHHRQTGEQQNPIEMKKLVLPLRKWTDPHWLSAILPEGGKVKATYR